MNKKNKTTAGLLGIFLGGFGAHKFYIGKPLIGFIYFITGCTLIPSILGIVEGIMYLVWNEEKFDAMIAEIESGKEMKRQAKLLAVQTKKDALIAQYGERDAEWIMNKQIGLGMSYAATVASWGRPSKEKDSVSGNTTKKKAYYNPHRNKNGTTSYKKEVSFENGYITGWKDL